MSLVIIGKVIRKVIKQKVINISVLFCYSIFKVSIDVTYDNIMYLPALSDTARFCFHSIVSGLENIPFIADWAEAIDIARSSIKDFSCASILSSTKTNYHFRKKSENSKMNFKSKGKIDSPDLNINIA